MAAFLKQQFCGGAPLQGNDTMVEGRLNSKAGAGASTTRRVASLTRPSLPSKAASSLCAPFPLFVSCFES